MEDLCPVNAIAIDFANQSSEPRFSLKKFQLMLEEYHLSQPISKQNHN